MRQARHFGVSHARFCAKLIYIFSPLKPKTLETEFAKLSNKDLLLKLFKMLFRIFGYENELIPETLTFDDVLLEPRYSEVLPRDVSTKTRIGNIELNIPFISAAMDTVTESEMAIAMALKGGAGVIHKNLKIERQVEEVERVKRRLSGVVTKPFTLQPSQTVADALELKKKHKFSTFPITDAQGSFLGLVTKQDLSSYANDTEVLLEKIMIPAANVSVTYQTNPIDLLVAKELFKQHHVSKIPVLESKQNPKLVGMLFQRDLESLEKYPSAARDKKGRLIVGAAVGVSTNLMERVAALVTAGVDFICLDSAHGHSKGVLDAVKSIKAAYPKLTLIAGNVVTEEGAQALIDAGVDAVKVGVGPGSICTTRDVAGTGMPQLSALIRVLRAAKKAKIPVIADGGISKPGSVVKALAIGASAVMAGSIFAGTDETPGDKIKDASGQFYKIYRGMGSVQAMEDGSAERYAQDSKSGAKLIAEGVVGKVPYKGSVYDIIEDFVGGLRSGMGYQGAKDITALQKNPKFNRQTVAGLKESGVHDVIVEK